MWSPAFHAHCCPHKDALLTILCSDTLLWDFPTWVPQLHVPYTLLGFQSVALLLPAYTYTLMPLMPQLIHTRHLPVQTPFQSVWEHSGHNFPVSMSFSLCMGSDIPRGSTASPPLLTRAPSQTWTLISMLDFSTMWTPSSSYLGSSILAGQPQPLWKPPRSSTLAPTLVPGSYCSPLPPSAWTFSATYLDSDVLLHLHGEVDLAKFCRMAFGIKHSGKEGKGK